MNFVFTGPAVVNGIHFEREHLVALAKEQGHTVGTKIRCNTPNFGLTFLVANLDFLKKKKTVKYQTATINHVTIITPEEFLKKMGFL